ncbi:putative indole-3-acetic acid-amido synthetase GH3.9 [Vitis vinifera]|uniref:Putative indole-3-acetic acid-amido synthetase GH3.9 n=1 Tax=Vitis vinifera TaxID=29760 RepID=A0A438KHA3_VITVI|nr:putative indole-3-acetic acid-amido synthetase GH3.9 [Vitis vinifera]
MEGKRLEYRGEEALKELEKFTAKADEVQENILKEIIARNCETEYLKKYMGDQKISGTSGGEPKMMPSIAEDLNRRTFLYNLIMPIMNQYIPGLDEGKAMFLYFVKAEMSTPCGLPARAVLTSYYKSKNFRCRVRDAFNDFTSPDQAILCTDSNQSMYCQLLAGLVHRHQVLRLGAVFASALLRAISFLERHWVHLCNDIRTGHLDSSITDPECRSSMSTILSSPNPHLADEIEEICSHPSWKGMLSQLWPRAKYIEAVITGSMAQYIPSLEYYSGGKLPLVCTMYASSECYFGVNMKPLCDPADVAFTLLPNMCYFEFIPLGENGTLLMDMDEEKGVPKEKLVDLVHVRLGCYYELVVTTFAGLNRYRIGDVLQVTGFHNRAPQFRFICRRNVVLSIDNDKTNEEDLHRSITMAKKLLEPYNALLVEYTSYADTSSLPGHYVLYWEITHCISTDSPSTPLDSKVLEECCIAVEEELDYIYRRCRTHDKSVGPLEIRLVQPGTFEDLMDLFISQGGSINQYKTPRCIKSSNALKLLNSNVEASFFSPRDPRWIP